MWSKTITFAGTIKDRNHDARAFVEMEYPNLSYGEMAVRTGLCKNTIYLIARELGLSRTREQMSAIKSRRAGP